MTRESLPPAAARPVSTVTIRAAGPEDLTAIADLHVASWRATYRGILTDEFLDGPLEDERRAAWRRKCEADEAGWPMLLVAEDAASAEKEGAATRARLVGFICVWPNHSPRWGTHIDNLHIAPDRKGEGIGRRLLAEAATRLMQIEQARTRPVYLTVFEQNTHARAVYEKLGGRAVETVAGDWRDGREIAMLRYVWDSPAAFLPT